MPGLRVAHVCCGLGGSLWTGAILGWDPIYALDIDPWRTHRLRQQRAAGWWPQSLRIETCDISRWEPPELDGGVDILAAGFSCKDISIAGRRAGLGGSQTGPTYQGCLTAIDAWRPTWIIFENSPEIARKGLGQVRADLVARGYAYRDGIIAATDVGAPHIRKRWYLVAHLACERRHGRGQLQARQSEAQAGPAPVADPDRARVNEQSGIGEEGGRGEGATASDNGTTPAADPDRDGESQSQRVFGDVRGRTCDCAAEAADPDGEGLQIDGDPGMVCSRECPEISALKRYTGARAWNSAHTHDSRVVDGLATREHRRTGDRGKRIAALGDAWVPLQAATAWCLLGGSV